MALSATVVHKALFAALFLLAAALVLWGGSGVTNYVQVSKFHKDFLVKWEDALKVYNLDNGPWPAFTDNGHVPYMDALVDSMQRRGLQPPRSNTKRPYVYIIRKAGPPKENVFLLCLPDRMVLYGISRSTFDRLDRFIDGRANPHRGGFIGHADAKDEFVGVWRL